MNKKAFTLIELLVVIVIIGLLLAILFPAFGRAREGARRALCANNLRQHGIAWYLYLDEHNDCFPGYGNPPSDVQCNFYTFGGKVGGVVPYSSYTANMRPLNRYLDVNNTNSTEIFHCPDDTKEYSSGKTVFDYYGTSYYFNSNISLFGAMGLSMQRPLSTITSPHSKVYLEMCVTGVEPGHGGKGDVYPNTPVMVLFIDGHVKGPYLYDSDFEPFIPTTTKPVINDPNGTSKPND